MLMKKILYILIAAISVLQFYSCTHKEPGIPTPQVTFSDEVEAHFESVSLSCKVSGNVTAERLHLEFSKDQNLSGSQRITFTKQGDVFSSVISGLEIETTYYYRYIIDNKISSYTDVTIRQFKTLDYSAPIVITDDASEISGTLATVHGTVEYACGKDIIEKGFRFGTDPNQLTDIPVDSDSFTTTIANLNFGSTYYYQAYAKSEIGLGAGEIKEFTTCNGVTFKPLEVSDVTGTSARVSSGILDDGGVAVEEQGFRFLEKSSPQFSFVSSTGVAKLENLTPATVYEVWFYAKTFESEFESERVEFSTIVKVEGITLNTDSIELVVDDNFDLIATIKPEGATDKIVTWSSTNPEVASIDQNGHVVALHAGETVICATSHDGSYQAFCNVKVQNKVDKITVSPAKITLMVGGEGQTLKCNTYPADAGLVDIVWSSSKETVATVDQNGHVTPVGKGTAKIWASTTKGDVYDGCTVTVEQPVTSFSIDPLSAEMWVGESKDFYVTLLPADADNQNYTATVTVGKDAVSISKAGNKVTVKALKVGTAKIQFVPELPSSSDIKTECVITVKAHVSSVSIKGGDQNIDVGKTTTLEAIVSPDEAYDKSVTWSVDNSEIAIIDNIGKVTGVAPGTATVTVTTTDSGKTATCKITVNQPVESVSLNKTALTLTEGDSETLKAMAFPEQANQSFYWSSNTPYVATVDSNGKVTAVKAGTADITATSKSNPAKYTTCRVTVTPKTIPVTSVSVSPEELTLVLGETAQISATVLPSNATNRTTRWSSNSSAVTVDRGLVTARQIGSALVMCTSEDNPKAMGTCRVTVVPPPGAVTSISLNKTNASLLYVDPLQLIATVYPSDAYDKRVQWTSSDLSVASVSQDGIVTAEFEPGTAIITARSVSDPSISASCTVKWVVPTTPNLSVEKNTITLSEGETDCLRLKLEPPGSISNIRCISSNPDVATAEDSGNSTESTGYYIRKYFWVKGISSGTAVLTFSGDGCSVQSSCTVTVEPSGNHYVEFNDPLFKSYCLGWYDRNNDGNLSYGEAERAESINVSSLSITSLKGIEAFTNLRSLQCRGSSQNVSPSGNCCIKEIDLCKNTKLSYLDCGNNQLTSLDLRNNLQLEVLYCGYNQLTSLDLRNNLQLEVLDCRGNQLSSLDVSSNTLLNTLDCNSNNLSRLNLSTSIKHLDCQKNQLTSIDVSRNAYLNWLCCYNNKITSLDVSNHHYLDLLLCHGNPLSSLSVRNCINLTRLNCSPALDGYLNYPRKGYLKQLDLSTNYELIDLDCQCNIIESLDLSNNTKLEFVNCFGNNISCLDVSNNLVLKELRCSQNPNLTSIWLKTGQSISEFYYDSSISTIYYK